MPHIGYKTLVTEDGKLCFAVLEIPDDALTNEDRSNVIVREKAKFRCSKAKVIDIHDLNGTQITEAYSQRDKTFKYVIGHTVESEFDPDINRACGKGIHYFLSEVIYVLNPEKSKYTGTYIGYHESGRIWREENYVAGKENGRYIEYYESGRIMQEANYVGGRQNGRFVEYCRSGQIEKESNFIDGKIDGRHICYYESGQIKEESNYVDGKCDGRCVRYHENGQIYEKANYVDGKRNGRCVCYDQSGQIKEQSNYIDGKRVE